MEADGLVTVYTLTDGTQAELIKNLLDSEGIRCFLAGEEASRLYPGLTPFQIKIQVPAQSADRARSLIHLHEHER